MPNTKRLNKYRKEKGYDAVFQGNGIDIGCGPKSNLSLSIFGGIASLSVYDQEVDPSHDANTCEDLKDNSYDFVYSSHCLEHMHDPNIAIRNWIRICKPQGHIICAVPHEIFYEKCNWPSQYIPDHKTSWTLEWKSNLPKSVHMPEFLYKINEEGLAATRLCTTILDGFDFNRFSEDQTSVHNFGNGAVEDIAVCHIEFILQKM